MQDAVVAATSAQESIVPGNGADSAFMTSECLDQFVLGSIPDLEVTSMSTYRKKRAIPAPLDASYTVVRANVA